MPRVRETTIVCDVGSVAADAIAVDTLARLQLQARRAGFELLLRNASSDLLSLVAFVGLDDVLRVEVQRQAEQGEHGLGVEEERELDDSSL